LVVAFEAVLTVGLAGWKDDPQMDEKPQPAARSSATAPRPAGLGRRLTARLLDAVVVFLPVSLLLALAGLPPPTFGLGGLEAWTHSAVTALLWTGYYIYFEAHGGGTLGKRLMHLRVRLADGRDPHFSATATRNLWLLFGLIPWVGGLLQLAAIVLIAVTIATEERHRGRHDHLAGTVVVV
jgi:uncharacterized RDD family membrane protein YckC